MLFSSRNREKSKPRALKLANKAEKYESRAIRSVFVYGERDSTISGVDKRNPFRRNIVDEWFGLVLVDGGLPS